MGDRYQAVAFSEYGDPDVLRMVELDAPEPGPGRVRIAVRAAGVNPIDWKLRSGELAAMMPVQLPAVPGVDLAGVVDAIGEGVTTFAVSDEVLGKTTSGGYATLALAAVDAIAAKPPELPWELAAGLPVAATTAYHVLAQLDLKTGETIVIDGAAGGVGTVAVQVARHRGLTVIDTASERNHDFLRSLGAIPVTYGDGLADRVGAVAPQGVDAAIDAAGRGSLPALVSLVGDPDRVISLADHSATELGARFAYGEPEDMAEILAEAGALAAAGTITLPIRTYPLRDAAVAQRESEGGHVRGKLILVPE